MPPGRTPLDLLLSVIRNPAVTEDLAADPGSWDEVKRLAEIHRFTGLLAYSASAWLPARERAWRDQTLMTHHRRHAERLNALRVLVESFRREGLDCVCLKGPLLAERYYAMPFLRPANDLDLLIRESDAVAAARLMKALGYTLEGQYPWSLQRKLSHHLNFAASDRSPRVEVHFDLKAGGARLASGPLIDRSVVWTSPAGFPASVLAPPDEAFYACLHAASHAFHRLRWLYDSVVISAKLTPEERRAVRNLAIHHGEEGMIVATGLAARELFGETLQLDVSGLAVPWLWRRLTPRDTRRMVERVEGVTSTLVEKFGGRLDLCRMAGSPWKALRLAGLWADEECRKIWCGVTGQAGAGVLARTLPE